MSSSVKSFRAALCSNKVQVKDPNVFSIEETKQALAAFNAMMAADPFQQAIEDGESWADVNAAAEAWNKRAEEPVCPNAPKKAKKAND
jgi:hypothetical protein